MKNYFLIYILFLSILSSCKEEERGQYPVDSIPPGQVTNIEVENVPGGAIVSYTIPDDDDLLYVKVDYFLDNGRPMEMKASAYANSLEIEGLGKSREQQVTITAVDRSANASAPVNVTIHPLDAPIFEVLKTVTVRDDFGGIRIDWENPLRADVVLTVSTPDVTNELVEVENFYSNARAGFGNLRGYPAEEKTFAIHLRDRWGNMTDTLVGQYHPLHEEILDRSKFRKWNPPGIPYVDLGWPEWTINGLWDGNTAIGFSLSSTVTLPHSITFDMGQTAKVSRFKLFQRTSGGQLYTGGNVKRFKLYGSDHPGVSDDPTTWHFLGNFESYKPSGLPLGQTTAEDLAYAGVAGEDYNLDLDAPRIRYIRMEVEATWGGSRAVQIMELQFFGDIQD